MMVNEVERELIEKLADIKKTKHLLVQFIRH